MRMSLREDLSGIVGNDLAFNLVLPSLADNTVPANLTGCTVNFIVKASQTALDSTGVTYSSPASGVVIGLPLLGQIAVAIPHFSNLVAGTFWYRADIVSSGSVYSALYGSFFIAAA
jgi:hypothetical protein